MSVDLITLTLEGANNATKSIIVLLDICGPLLWAHITGFYWTNTLNIEHWINHNEVIIYSLLFIDHLDYSVSITVTSIFLTYALNIFQKSLRWKFLFWCTILFFRSKKIHLIHIYIVSCFTEASELRQTSKMELFPKIVNGFQLLTVFAKSPVLDVWLGSKFASVLIIMQVEVFHSKFPVAKPNRCLARTLANI